MANPRARKRSFKMEKKQLARLNMQIPQQEEEDTATLYVRGVSPESIEIFNKEATRLGFKRFGNNKGKFFDYLAQAIKNGKKSA
jgi:hypothetical protein